MNIAHHQGFTNSIQFIANGDNPAQDTPVTVRIESAYPNIAAREVTLTIKAVNALHHFNVTVVPDTIAQTDSARILVQAKDIYDNDIDLPNETELAFVLDSEGSLIGTLLAVDGFSSNALSGISYQDARNGEIKFVAKSAPPPFPTAAASSTVSNSTIDSSLIVGRALISVFAASDAGKAGTGAVVVRKKVKIRVIPQVTQLKPLGDGDNKKLDPTCTVPKGQPDTCRRIIDFSKVKPTTVTVFVTDMVENPLANYPFSVTALVRPNSGGHDHTDGRPTGSFEVRGFDFPVVTFQGQTDPNGLATYRYFSSGVGGVDSIFVRGVTDKDTSSAIILLEMGELGELTDGEHYDLIGAYGEPGVNSEHRKNHYGRENLRTKLAALADSAYADSSYILRINDMSLELGGLFDIDNNWNTPHQKHREGVSVDIDDKDSNEKTIFKEDLERWLQSIAPKAKLQKEGDHFHATIR